jgi:hypothetical protein
MLSEMQNPTGPAAVANPAIKPDMALAGDIRRAGESGSAPQSVSIHGHTESLRYLLRHLSANWSSRVEAGRELRETPADPQEL